MMMKYRPVKSVPPKLARVNYLCLPPKKEL